VRGSFFLKAREETVQKKGAANNVKKMKRNNAVITGLKPKEEEKDGPFEHAKATKTAVNTRNKPSLKLQPSTHADLLGQSKSTFRGAV